MNIDFRGGETRGFGYCYVRGRAGDLDVLNEIGAKRVLARVDGKEVVVTNRKGLLPPQWIFERDEYVLFYVQVYLGSPHGGV